MSCRSQAGCRAECPAGALRPLHQNRVSQVSPGLCFSLQVSRTQFKRHVGKAHRSPPSHFPEIDRVRTAQLPVCKALRVHAAGSRAGKVRAGWAKEGLLSPRCLGVGGVTGVNGVKTNSGVTDSVAPAQTPVNSEGTHRHKEHCL